jgi:hypothetical protein
MRRIEGVDEDSVVNAARVWCMIFTAIKRYLIILVAYLLSVAVTAFGVGVVTFVFESGNSILPFLPLCAFAGIIICVFASAPATILVGIGEWRAWTALWFYAGFGVLAGLVLGVLFKGHVAWLYPIAGVVLGALAGTVYWAVAGRHAGVLKTQETARAQTHLLLLLGSSVVIIALLFLVFTR